MGNIREYHLKIAALYSSLDIFLEANPDILATIDNSDNLYSYSDKLRLFDTLSMMESSFSSFSTIDLKIRFVHHAIVQYGILDKFSDENYKDIVTDITDELFTAIKLADSIKEMLHEMIKSFISPEDLHNMPAYLLNMLAERKLYKEER